MMTHMSLIFTGKLIARMKKLIYLLMKLLDYYDFQKYFLPLAAPASTDLHDADSPTRQILGRKCFLWLCL